MIKEIKLDRNTFIFMEVPDKAYDFSLRRNNEVIYLLRDVINPLTNCEKSEIIDIPNAKFGLNPKDYTIIGTVDELLNSEDACRDVVDLHSITRLSQFGFKDYVKSVGMSQDYTLETSIESFKTLLTSLEIDLTKQWLLLLKQR